MKIYSRQPEAPARRVLERDLQSFPQPWREFLDTYGVQVVVLEGQETLADSPAIAREAVADAAAWKDRVQSVVGPAFDSVEPNDDPVASSQFRDQMVDNLHAYLNQQSSPYRVASHRSPLNLDELAGSRNVAEPFRQQWKQDLLDLNSPWSSQGADGFATRHGVFLLPPVPTSFGAVPDRDYQNAVTTTAESVGESLGLNRGSEQRVLLHSRYLLDQAPEIGDYRVAIHEVGHALDYALEGLPDETGFGQQHKATVLACFQEARSFTSDRADDNVREFFAEAVEAYLTPPSSGFDFRPDNHQASLRERNPRMAAYLDHLFRTTPGADWVSKPPLAVGVPEGFPDPDRDPVYLG